MAVLRVYDNGEWKPVIIGPTGPTGPTGPAGLGLGNQTFVTISTTTATLDPADAGNLHRFTHASGCTVTIPNAAVSTQWFGVQLTEAQVTLVGASGVTLVAFPSNKTDGLGAHFSVTIDSPGQALVTGGMEII